MTICRYDSPHPLWRIERKKIFLSSKRIANCTGRSSSAAVSNPTRSRKSCRVCPAWASLPIRSFRNWIISSTNCDAWAVGGQGRATGGGSRSLGFSGLGPKWLLPSPERLRVARGADIAGPGGGPGAAGGLEKGRTGPI